MSDPLAADLLLGLTAPVAAGRERVGIGVTAAGVLVSGIGAPVPVGARSAATDPG
ncbi:hypothetical protein [Actinomadura flavalba]|uniref:hypothetical protein n=1 Tax=Actinomadura flavalba TaxID=1120938 RepID=UPI0003796A2C|nr:hypothetical protein [Actinomadura flavalba]